MIRDAAFGGERLLAADRDAPQAAIHRIGSAVRWDRELAILEILELFGPLERLVAHRRENRELRRERAQRDFEAHLIVAGRRAAVRDDFRAELARVFGDRLRLHDALGADAQRIHLAALDVAHDQEPDHLIEVRPLRLDEDVVLRAERVRTLIEHLRRVSVDAAGVDGHRDDRDACSSP